MKFRSDFVTNSSSSSYCITIGVILKDGSDVNYTLRAPQDDSGDIGRITFYGDSFTWNDDFWVKQLVTQLQTPETVTKLINLLKNLTEYEEPETDEYDEYDDEEDDEYDEEESEDGEEEAWYSFTDNPEDLFESSPLDPECREPAFYVGLDNRKTFSKDLRKKAKKLEEISEIYVKEEYSGYGAEIPSKAFDLYEKAYHHPFDRASVEISVKHVVNRETGAIREYIDDKEIHSEN